MDNNFGRKFRALLPGDGKNRLSLRIGGIEPLSSLQSEINNIVERFLDVAPIPGFLGGDKSFVPELELKDFDDRFEVVLSVPGFSLNELEVNIEEQSLKVSGERRNHANSENNGKPNVYSEFRYGFFERIIPLSSEIQRDNADCQLKDGLLTIVVHKAIPASKMSQKLNIRAG
jgi:HSP20 family protein